MYKHYEGYKYLTEILNYKTEKEQKGTKFNTYVTNMKNKSNFNS